VVLNVDKRRQVRKLNVVAGLDIGSELYFHKHVDCSDVIHCSNLVRAFTDCQTL
jgi:hypothetical protein